MTKCISVYVMAEPGPLHDGLIAMLNVLPQVDIIGDTGSSDLALQKISEAHPDLILMDGLLVDPAHKSELIDIKRQNPHTKLILLVDTIEDMSQAWQYESDEVLLKGMRAEKLFAIIEGLLPTAV